MSSLPPDDPARGSAGGRPGTWRARYDAARAEGVPLDPTSEPVEGVNAYPTPYAPDHLLVTTTEDLEPILDAAASRCRGFRVGDQAREPRPHAARHPDGHRPGPPRSPESSTSRRSIASRSFRSRARTGTTSPCLRSTRGGCCSAPAPAAAGSCSRREPRPRDDRGSVRDQDQPVRDRRPARSDRRPTPSDRRPTRGTDSYGAAGSGGRQVVSYLGPPPVRTATPSQKRAAAGGRHSRHGLRDHPWLPDSIVTRYPELDKRVIGAQTCAPTPRSPATSPARSTATSTIRRATAPSSRESSARRAPRPTSSRSASPTARGTCSKEPSCWPCARSSS